ncbi:PAS modulated sigma54 specific transcriptional regulator, Fis family [Candidatus Moduliflexus flocculans]|uniref:PAS modulated sigma54 specific transcriptional regulator, Fis family n=1 Tax=Candidatus Moduliflexus flocculans TaxID=1499966 RepID=A0A081BM11_9BACT|nr:PAS modulated sigma54 specific transcriptional regulator, Fis family [Candidatus Moduliflexus flocculans]
MNTMNILAANILLIDDNPQNLAALSRILAEQQYQVRTAINGQVALKSIQHRPPDLILLDIMMPNMDGYEVCSVLKAQEETRDIPIIFLSALDAPLDKVKAFQVGGVDYITKPFQMDEVVARVQTHLALKLMREQLQAQNRELEVYRHHLEELVEQRTEELRQVNAHLHGEIAERTRVEEALRASEQQYRMMAEQVQHGIAILQDQKIVFCNAAFLSIAARPAKQVLEQNILEFFPEMARQRIGMFLQSQEKPSLEWQEQLRRNGDKLWVELEQKAIRWNGQPAVLLTVRDVHEYKLRELRLEDERERLQKENTTFKSTLTERYRFGELIGKSQAMQRVYELTMSAAASDVNALIVGESGTGKELIARTIYQISARKQQAFVAVNCASIPETLFEREFFGHRKGAFTGADRDKAGLFDQAHRGVLFLDEVTELTPGMQAKLLRVLQSGEYFPLGSTTPKQANVLLIAATNKDYKALLQQGKMREDFFYRVCVIEIPVPPLRERKDDLPLLIDHFLELARRKRELLSANAPRIPDTLPGHVAESLYRYDWPGNVRELQNTIQRYLATQHLDSNLPLIQQNASARALLSPSLPNFEGGSLTDAMNAFEKQVILDALEKNQYHKIQTAKMLGIPRSTLHRKIKELGIAEGE